MGNEARTTSPIYYLCSTRKLVVSQHQAINLNYRITYTVAGRIHLVRGQKVILDVDLAMLYGVTTKRFNEQVRRNLSRFPSDFMFRLTAEEDTALRSQIATSKTGRGGRRYLPYVFTEHGAIMAATILNSSRAIEMSVFIVRAFVQLREALATHRQPLHWFDVPRDWSVIPIGKVAQEVSAVNSPGEALPVLSCTKYGGLVDSLMYFDKQVFSHGETYLYLGRQYRLKVVSDERNSVKLARGMLFVATAGASTPDKVKELLDSWYRGRARSVFFSVLEQSFQYFRKRGHEVPRVTVRTMQRRWGSLSPTRAMTLNSNLVRAPKSCVEYVILHELCHLVHRHHESSFYRLLTQLIPDWQKRKARLEEALL